MARLKTVSGLRLGELEYQPATSLAPAVKVEVHAEREVFPFDMSEAYKDGAPTKLAAMSLLWATENLGAVVRDSDGNFHALTTKFPRAVLGDKIKFAPAEPTASMITLVEFVALPAMEFQAELEREEPGQDRCFVESALTTTRAKGRDQSELVAKIHQAGKDWKSWWTRFVDGKQQPPPPPESISKPLVEVVAELFSTTVPEIAVLQSKDELVSNQISLNLYNDVALGQGGALRDDLRNRVKMTETGQVPVVLQILAGSFLTPVPELGIVATGVHEAAHYRHYLLTSTLVDAWRRTSGSRRSEQNPRSSARWKAFVIWLDRERRLKRISSLEFQLVQSTLGVIQASHPLAQIYGFAGTYGDYPKEVPRDPAVKGHGRMHQVRFKQLLEAAVYWKQVTHPDVAAFSVKAVVDLVAREDECARMDLQHLCAEVANQPTHQGAGYFRALAAELQKMQ